MSVAEDTGLSLALSDRFCSIEAQFMRYPANKKIVNQGNNSVINGCKVMSH